MTEKGEQILHQFYAYWDRKVRKGVEFRLTGVEVCILEEYMAWLLKHYRLEEIKKR